MPDWLSPFHLPKLTDAQFLKAKSKYNEKYGYTVQVPALEDIIIIDTFVPMSSQEILLWKQRKYDEIPAWRRWQIQEHKDAKRQKFLQMLASPVPGIFNNVGSIMSALDDAQDALGTLAWLGSFLIKILPQVAAKFLTGPVGWLLGAAQMLSFATYVTGVTGRVKDKKGLYETKVTRNPFGTTAQAGRLYQVQNFGFSFGQILQTLQVTGSVFGVGIALGPILGYVQDLAAGLVRMTLGQEVKWVGPREMLPDYFAKIGQAFKAFGYLFNIPFQTPEPELTNVLVATYIAQHAVAPFMREFDFSRMTPDLSKLRFMAPIPKDPTTIEIIEEEGLEVLPLCGWPHNGDMWTDFDSWVMPGKDVATENLYHLLELNPSNQRGDLIAFLGREIAMQGLVNIAGEGNVRYNYNAAIKFTTTLLQQGYHVSENTTAEKMNRLIDWLAEFDSVNDSPDLREIIQYCKNNSIDLVSIRA